MNRSTATLRISQRRWTFAALLCAVLFSSRALAGTNTWTSHGPGGRRVRNLVIDPITPTTLYATSSFPENSYNLTVIKSIDGGATWDAANSGLPNGFVNGLSTAFVNHLAIDPTTPSTLYAAMSVYSETNTRGGVFKSTDGGTSWVAAGLPDVVVNRLAIDPITPSTLYAGTLAGVFKSTDAGASWVEANRGLTDAFPEPGTAVTVQGLAIDPLNPDTVYAGVSAATDAYSFIARVFKSTDAGATWVSVSAGLADDFVDATSVFLVDLAIDPGMPSTLYAAVEIRIGISTTIGRVFKSTNGGATWAAANVGLTDAPVNALAIDPLTAGTLYVGTWDGVFKSTNAGVTWTAADSGLTNSFANALAIDPLNPGTLYAGMDAGIFKSTDAGATWRSANSEPPYISINTLAIDPTTPSTLYAGAGPDVFKSVDGGMTWHAANRGLPYGPLASVAALVVDPITPSTLYAGTHDGVFKSTDGGATWDEANNGLLPPIVIVLAIDPVNPATLYAVPSGAFVASGVFKSTDAGETWNPTRTGLPNFLVRRLVVDPVTTSTLYAVTAVGLFKSTDAGATWAATTDDMPVYDVVIDPVAPGTLYAATNDGFSKSTDAGTTWSVVSDGPPAAIITLVIDPVMPDTVYAGTPDGVFKSTDAGLTWNAIDADPTHILATALVIDPINPNRLYAATPNGVFAIEQGTECVGDCDGDGRVAIEELILGTGIVVGSRSANACPAFADERETVDVTQLMKGLRNALEGCSRADVVLLNGKVFTGNAARPWVEAVAIRGERIVAIGTNDEVRGLAGAARVVDVGGRTIIPGINDAHMHVATLPSIAWADRGLDPTFDTQLGAMAQLASSVPAGRWIGGPIGATILDDPDATRDALDEVAPDHLVYLEGFTGHGLLVNTPVLDLLGIADDEPDPLGGFFVREPGSNIITGLAQEYAKFWITRELSRREPRNAQVATFRLVSELAKRYGITSVQLMNNDLTTADAASLLAEADPPIRWRVIRFPFPQDDGWPLDRPGGLPVTHPHVQVSGLKWILDGTPVERLAAMRAPYSDKPETAGQENFAPEVVHDMLARAVSTGEQPIFHASGDRTIETILDEMESLGDAAFWRSVRVRLEHGDLILPDLIERARELGVIVVQNPLHFLNAELNAERWGSERLAHAMPLASLAQAGIPIALGSDVNGTFNPYADIMHAMLHPTNPAEALTVEQALAAHTSGAAFAEFAEHGKGRLLPGMLADLAVLSQDIFSVPVAQLPQTLSVLTMVGGRVVHCEAPQLPSCPSL